MHPLAIAALTLHKLGLDIGRAVHSHQGKVIVEHPVNQDCVHVGGAHARDNVQHVLGSHATV